jgi:hypothetical protein
VPPTSTTPAPSTRPGACWPSALPDLPTDIAGRLVGYLLRVDDAADLWELVMFERAPADATRR